MKQFVKELGEWLRHKIRVIVMKQWKRPKTIYRNLSYLNWKHKNRFAIKKYLKLQIRDWVGTKKRNERGEFHYQQGFLRTSCKPERNAV